MAAHKNGISRHKSSPTQVEAAKDAVNSPVFDIIPRTRVRPSASSRPVIASNQPAVADTTLKQPDAAPLLDIPQPNLDPAGQAKKAPAPEEKGVLVSELMAKKQAAAEAPQLTVTDEKAEPAEAAEAPATMVHEKTIEPPDANGEPDKAKADEGAGEAGASEPEAKPADDSLEAALKDDDKPQEQSSELKDAIKDMDSSSLRHHDLYEGKPVIVVHKHHVGAHPALAWTLWFILCLAVALLIVDLLLDAGIVTTNYIVPHTNFL